MDRSFHKIKIRFYERKFSMKGLDRLKIGEEAVVINTSDNRRLADLGLVEGTRIKCVLRSPLGDPAAYNIRGAVVAIRNEDASIIGVETDMS